MKFAFGANLLFQIVIFFVVIFTGYICISINQAKAFNVKNEIVKTVERNAPNLLSIEFREDIVDAFDRIGYRLTGECSTGYKGYDREGNLTSSNNAAFCLKDIITTMPNGTNAVYYKVETFYHLDIPIIKILFQLKASGETKLIYNKSVQDCSVC